MKELPNIHQEKKGYWRGAQRAAAIVMGLAAFTACEQSPITEGTVYKKEHIKTETSLIVVPKGVWPIVHREVEAEGGPPSHYSKKFEATKDAVQQGSSYRVWENWNVYFSQCPKGELPPQDKIEKECKTNSSEVPVEAYNNIQIGQHVDFKQSAK